ncbi:MAG: HEPN domain-containing protein [Candidatus Diapherotrites archaeon]|nr:HEPN domain-containing protein [Candidatus Diapherotrites archaeon]
MDLKELLQKHLIEKVDADANSAKELIKSAEKDLVAAADILNAGHADWAFVAAYNAMLSAGRALMAAKGYRALSESHHVAVVQFCAAMLPAESGQLIYAFNRYRVRRHDVVYGEIKSIGEGEAKTSIGKAKEFTGKIRGLCKLNQ